ncbi:hypothetical protein TNCV_3789501 [Trichonephila clavipes]|nr:hypothetical protein TNCV_3789501 [Trichonephila clavipes]
MWTTPELSPLSPNYHTPHTNGRTFHLLKDSPLRRILSGIGFELVTRPAMIRYLDHSATAATHYAREAFQEYCGVFSSDIAPTTHGREKNTPPPKSKNIKFNLSCKRRPPHPKRLKRQFVLKTLERTVECLPPSSIITHSVGNS